MTFWATDRILVTSHTVVAAPSQRRRPTLDSWLLAKMLTALVAVSNAVIEFSLPKNKRGCYIDRPL